MLSRRGFVSCIHRRKPRGKPMPERTRLANARKSKVRSAVEHVFAPEGADGPRRPNNRPGARAAENRARQPRLQYAPPYLAAAESSGRVGDAAHGPRLDHRAGREDPSSGPEKDRRRFSPSPTRTSPAQAVPRLRLRTAAASRQDPPTFTPDRSRRTLQKRDRRRACFTVSDCFERP